MVPNYLCLQQSFQQKMAKKQATKKFITSALVCMLACCALLAAFAAQPLYAQGTPTVVYNPNTKTVTIGSADINIVAGSQIITLPNLSTTLINQGFSDVLVNQSGTIWLLKARILIERTGRLEVSGAGASELELESTPANFINITARNGGNFLLDGVKVTSWDTAASKPDENLVDGRSYLAAIQTAPGTCI